MRPVSIIVFMCVLSASATAGTGINLFGRSTSKS